MCVCVCVCNYIILLISYIFILISTFISTYPIFQQHQYQRCGIHASHAANRPFKREA